MMPSKYGWSGDDYELESEFEDVSRLVRQAGTPVPTVPTRLDRSIKRYLSTDTVGDLKKSWIFSPAPQLALAASLLFGVGLMFIHSIESQRVNRGAIAGNTAQPGLTGLNNPLAQSIDPEMERIIKSRQALADTNSPRTKQIIQTGVANSSQEVLEQGFTSTEITPFALSSDQRALRRDENGTYGRWQTQEQNTESYANLDTSPVKFTTEQPISTFSIDVDTAAYSNLRRMIQQEGRLPPTDAVRIEELINYFSYDYITPESEAVPFSLDTEMSVAPWNHKRQLLRIGIKGYEPAFDQRPAANLVFLIDVSGSMQQPNKLPLVKRALRLLVKQMTAKDKIALVVYAGAAGQVLAPTGGSDKAKIYAAIDSLTAGGGTNGAAGIELAYQLAEKGKLEAGINRVILASDGDFNLGLSNVEQLKSLVAVKRQAGIAFSTLGFGTGNYNDHLMEQLADVGNGTAAYIDSMREAQKVFVTELQSTLLTIAKDVKIQVEFNPAVVSEYRLIGYENRRLAREDFANDKVDAGDIGAGHSVTALYELVLTGSGGEYAPPKHYGLEGDSQAGDTQMVDVQVGATPISNQPGDEIGFIRLRYKHPSETVSRELTRSVSASDIESSTQATGDFKFAAAVAGYGQKLRGGKYLGDWGYEQALAELRSSKGADKQGYRAELINLVELTKSLAEPD